MMRWRAGQIGVFLALVLSSNVLVRSYGVLESPSSVCHTVSPLDVVFLGISDSCSPLDLGSHRAYGGYRFGVVEVDELSLQKVLNLIPRDSESYVAMLFHSSWCPFSKMFMPMFGLLSSLFPTIHHIAIEESAVRPSVLAKYGVHGFPTLVLQNSTTRVSYHGSKRLGALISFFVDVTGIKPSSRDLSLSKARDLFNLTKMVKDNETEHCPFSWAQSPEKWLQEETYLALATAFLLLRVLHFLLPWLLSGARWFWRHARVMRIAALCERLRTYCEQAVRIFSRMCCVLKPCKGGNLQGGALNARAWASNSLVSVSISEVTTSRTPL